MVAWAVCRECIFECQPRMIGPQDGVSSESEGGFVGENVGSVLCEES